MLLHSREGLFLSLVQPPSALGHTFFSFSKSLLCHFCKPSSFIVRVPFDAWKSLLGVLRKAFLFFRKSIFPDFVIAYPKNLHQRVSLFSDVLPSALFGCKPPCSEVA